MTFHNETGGRQYESGQKKQVSLFRMLNNKLKAIVMPFHRQSFDEDERKLSTSIPFMLWE